MPDIYVRVSGESVARTSTHSGNTLNVDLDRYGVPVGVEVLGALEVRVDGVVCRCAPTPSAAPAQTDDALVSAIAESLQDFQVSAGGMLLSLTETERRRIGWTVRGVCQQVVRDGP